MPKRFELYLCPVCSNIVEVCFGADGQLYCCGEPMKLLPGNTTDAAVEKHVPVIEKIDGGYKVSVGSVAHPMAEDHYIQWIELVTEDTSSMKFLKPGDEPSAVFMTDAEAVIAREYCNKHGHWRTQL
jgi:superoxide reductase